MTNLGDFHLKPLNESNLKLVFHWRNLKEIKTFMYSDHHIKWDEHYQWFEQVKSDPQRKVLLLYNKGRPLGLVNFRNIDHKNSRCYWGFYIGEITAPKGSGTIMGILALDKIFNEVGIHKVCAEVIHTNYRSVNYHKKLGFVTEGRLVHHLWKENQYVDIISMALFTDKWTKVRAELLTEQKGGQ